jgi:hypothetical protein
MAELYDPITGLFTRTGSMKTARQDSTATALADGRVLLTGGLVVSPEDATVVTYLSSAELYEPVTGRFAPTGSMKTARSLHAAVLLRDGRVLIAGGVGTEFVDLSSAELYDPVTGTFAPTGSMKTVRNVPAAALMNDGRVLVAGESSAEIYDLTTGKFTPSGPSSGWPGYVTLLRDGRLLAADRLNGPGPNVEIYDPRTGAFTVAGAMPDTSVKMVVRLSDGRVLFPGQPSVLYWP